MWMLILTSRNHEATRDKNLVEPSTLVLPVFTAINKRDALKAAFRRLGGLFVCLFFSFWMAERDWHAEDFPRSFYNKSTLALTSEWKKKGVPTIKHTGFRGPRSGEDWSSQHQVECARLFWSRPSFWLEVGIITHVEEFGRRALFWNRVMGGSFYYLQSHSSSLLLPSSGTVEMFQMFIEALGVPSAQLMNTETLRSEFDEKFYSNLLHIFLEIMSFVY